MEALTKRVEKLEAYVRSNKGKKDKNDSTTKYIKRKKLDSIVQKMFSRPKVLQEAEKKEENKEEAPA